jgi:hypothetical protein
MHKRNSAGLRLAALQTVVAQAIDRSVHAYLERNGILYGRTRAR